MNEYAPRSEAPYHAPEAAAERSHAEQTAESAPLAGHEDAPNAESARLEAIRSRLEQVATSTQETPLPDSERASVSAADRPWYAERTLKAHTLQRSLQYVRAGRPGPERAFSRLIHQPAVRTVSEVASKTAGRPFSLLLGGICAFIGSLVFFYMTQHIGLSYNYLLWSLFFFGGLAVGLVIELLLVLLRRVFRPSV